MPTIVEKRRLRWPYQPLNDPRTAAPDAMDAMRTNDLRTTNPPLRGTNGNPRIYPFWVKLQEVGQNLLEPLAIYAIALMWAAAAMALVLVLAGYTVGNVWVVLTLAAVAALAERSSVRLTSTMEESISLLPTVFAGVLFGPLAAMAIGGASMLADFRRPYTKWAIYTASRSITGAVVGFAAVASSGAINNEFGAVAAATVSGALVGEILSLGFASVTIRLRGRASVREVFQSMLPTLGGSLPLYVPLVALLAFAYAHVSPWTLPLFFLPALAAQRLYVLYQLQRTLTDELVSANEQVERAGLSFATALVATLDARDQYTAGHSAAVAIYARDITKRMDLSDSEQRLAHMCGLVHDIGKIGLSPGLLEKPGALTLDERRQMEKHSEIGERILAKVESYAEIAKIVRHHHERVDGEGYPDGISGDNIPLLARIIAVADAYNAMTSDRPYRDAMPSRVARMRLAQAVDSQFDTSVVAAFEAILASADDSYRSGTREDFTLGEQESVNAVDLSHVA
jgi:putative nucleotidyltransferase with HDIG domain